MSGNARGPSTAFCLMFRLCQLKPTPAQIRMMLDHKDSPYIRAVRAGAWVGARGVCGVFGWVCVMCKWQGAAARRGSGRVRRAGRCTVGGCKVQAGRRRALTRGVGSVGGR